MNETFLNKSIPEVSLEDYRLVARRDRSDDSGWGGICCFARTEVSDLVVKIHEAEFAERFWTIFHSTCGLFLLACQYRPPCNGELDSIHSLEDELLLLRQDTFGTIIIGDFNCHSTH